MIRRGGLPQLLALQSPADTAKFDHGRHGSVELIVGPGGDLAGVTGLEIPKKLLGGAELVGFKRSPRSLAIQGDSCVKTAARLPDVKSGGRGGFPTCWLLFHTVLLVRNL